VRPARPAFRLEHVDAAAQTRRVRDEARSPQLVVRAATVADAPTIAAIGGVGFPAVHNEIVSPAFAAAVVEQTIFDRGADRVHHPLRESRRRGVLGG
jgi:hypothetical protein